MLPRSSRPRAAWGTGVYPSKQYFDIKMRCLQLRQELERSAQTIGFNTGFRTPCCVLCVQVIGQAVLLAGIADGKRSAVLRTDDVAHRLGDVIGVVFRLRNAKVIARPDGKA